MQRLTEIKSTYHY